MNSKLLILFTGAALLPAALATDRYDRVEPQDMRQAIAFERHKQEAAARQARIERRRAGTESRADRSADRTGRQQRERREVRRQTDRQ